MDNVMEVATELITEEAVGNSDRLLQTLVLLPLYIFILCRIPMQRSLLKKKTNPKILFVIHYYSVMLQMP